MPRAGPKRAARNMLSSETPQGLRVELSVTPAQAGIQGHKPDLRAFPSGARAFAAALDPRFRWDDGMETGHRRHAITAEMKLAVRGFVGRVRISAGGPVSMIWPASMKTTRVA